MPGHFSGWRGAAHGGIITTLLDETMVYACTSTGWLTVTGTITVKFHRPVPTETPLEVTGTVLRNRGRSISAEGAIREGGVLLASAEGVFIPVKKLEDPLETIKDRLVP
ncbi:MAG TPA: PaaI family thioesterase [Candidatus Sabulitectum sp.]|nr:PaaI family thioesterase [Candidatus Sabulitectum sp.]HPJ28755.1 PaaI family thioesterase [Candidatus Sabulitectum sp.]HPR22420.1 PaaI family thioesterase [Candidatus Sabulitectum sp.]